MDRATTPRQRAGVLAVMVRGFRRGGPAATAVLSICPPRPQLNNPPWCEAGLKVLCTDPGSSTLLGRAATAFHVDAPRGATTPASGRPSRPSPHAPVLCPPPTPADVVSVQDIPAVGGDDDERATGSPTPSVATVHSPPPLAGSQGGARREATALRGLPAPAGASEMGTSSDEDSSPLPLFRGAGAASGKCGLCSQQLGMSVRRGALLAAHCPLTPARPRAQAPQTLASTSANPCRAACSAGHGRTACAPRGAAQRRVR